MTLPVLVLQGMDATVTVGGWWGGAFFMSIITMFTVISTIYQNASGGYIMICPKVSQFVVSTTIVMEVTILENIGGGYITMCPMLVQNFTTLVLQVALLCVHRGHSLWSPPKSSCESGDKLMTV